MIYYLTMLSFRQHGPFRSDKRQDTTMTNALLRRFLKDGDPGDPAVRTRCGKLAGAVGIFCNLLLFAGKLLVGLLSNSLSIMADAVNNLSDASSSVVTLIGFRMSEKPADRDHPFGHARIEYISGMAVATLILVIGVELAKSSVQKILHPEPVQFGALLVGVLLASILVKLWMAFFNRSVGRLIHSSTLEATFMDSRNDVITTSAVLLASAAGAVFHINLDGWMGLAVALFILYSGIGILRDTIDPLLGEAPTAELTRTIADKLLSYDKVLGVHDLIVHDYGPGRRFASVHVEMDAALNVLVSHDIIDNIERDFEENDHIELVIHYDPVIVGDPVVDETHAWVQEKVHSVDERLRIHDFRMVSGASHTNLIFDVVRPQELELSDDELRSAIQKAVRSERPDCFVVLHVDSNYVTVGQKDETAKK